MSKVIRFGAGATSALALAALLAACGGGGSSGDGSTADSSNVTASGVITGFGSIYVNGVRYDTSGAEIEFEDEGVRTEDDLRLGMRVRVEGRRSGRDGSAERVFFDEDLKGPVSGVTPDDANPAVGTFTVLGQTVTVTGDTVFDNDVGDNNADGAVDINDLILSSGTMVVEVSGFPQDGGVLATRIDRVNDATSGQPGVDGDEYEIKGTVDTVASDGSSFTIGGTTFQVTTSTVFDDGLSASADLVGVFVEVKADEDNGSLVAVEVQREDDFGDRHDGEFEIEGILQSVDTDSTPNTVTISGIVVPVVDASPLSGSIGRKVEIEGRFNADGVLVLGEVENEAEDTVRTEDSVASVGAESFTTRLGVVVRPDGMSRVEDDDGDDGDRLTPAEFLSRLQIGDRIQARGYPDGTGVQWTRVARDNDSDTDCSLRGPVSSFDASAYTLVVQGVTVDASGTGVQFELPEDMTVGRDAFFAAVSSGTVIEADSDDAGVGCQDGTLTADQVEIESSGAGDDD